MPRYALKSYFPPQQKRASDDFRAAATTGYLIMELKKLCSLLLLLAGVFAVDHASAQTTISNIEQKTGWESCTVCAGAGGAGLPAIFSLQQSISSPSMDGSAMQFFLGGDTPYTQALWWRQLGAQGAAHNLKYDLYFYMTDPNSSQALEFDANQSVGGKKYIFGTECNLKETHTWRVWDTANAKWVSTGVYCPTPVAYKWNHLTWVFQRTSDNKVKFVSVTLNGATTYINRYYYPKSSSVNELNVAFQMDGNKYQTDYNVWLDKVSLIYW